MKHTNPPKKLQDLNLMDRFLFSELKNCTLAKARQFLYLTYRQFASLTGLGHKNRAAYRYPEISIHLFVN